MKLIHIAIDGPAGAGKSTIAKNIAKKLDILHLDTGAMYRAIGLYALTNNIEANNEKLLTNHLDNINIDVKYEDKIQKTILNGLDVTNKIRIPEVSIAASTVSKWPCVRKKLVAIQKQISKTMSIVMDGRDIGTFVLPNAEFKFFLTASVDQRAMRRYLELREKGREVSLEKIKQEIKDRDYRDTNREFAPLMKAEDAIEIDTTKYNIDEVCQIVFDKIGIENESN